MSSNIQPELSPASTGGRTCPRSGFPDPGSRQRWAAAASRTLAGRQTRRRRQPPKGVLSGGCPGGRGCPAASSPAPSTHPPTFCWWRCLSGGTKAAYSLRLWGDGKKQRELQSETGSLVLALRGAGLGAGEEGKERRGCLWESVGTRGASWGPEGPAASPQVARTPGTLAR